MIGYLHSCANGQQNRNQSNLGMHFKSGIMSPFRFTWMLRFSVFAHTHEGCNQVNLEIPAEAFVKPVLRYPRSPLVFIIGGRNHTRLEIFKDSKIE